MNQKTLLSWVLMLVLAFGFSFDADAQKKKKKKKNKKGEPTAVVIPPSRIINSDTSEVCQVFTFTEGKPSDQDLARISQTFADMNLRRQVKDYGPGEYSALYYWEQMYKEAPGFSILIYTDGSAIHREMAAVAKEEGDTVKMNELAEKALDLLDKGEECYPDTEGKFGPARAYIYELIYPTEFEKIYELYTDGFGPKTDPYSLMAITRYALYMGYIERITPEEAVSWLEKTRGVAKANPGDKDYEYALEVIDLTWEEQYKDLYAQKEAAEQQQQQAVVKQDEQATATQASNAVYNEMLEALEQGDVVKGSAKFNEYYNMIDDNNRKYQVAMYVGQTLYNLNDYPKARSAFQKAAASDPNQGDPYYFIGSMYLSSGPVCGPGTGFDSQRVIWPAFDKYNQALAKPNINPEFATDIASTIATYKEYLPTDAQIAEQGLTVGSSYTVPCWINEVTTVRSSASMSN